METGEGENREEPQPQASTGSRPTLGTQPLGSRVLHRFPQT